MTVRPATVNFNLYQGATFSEPVTLKDAAGDPIDLTGATAKLQARRDISDPSAVFTLTSQSGGIALGGATGVITLLIDAATTAGYAVDWDGEFWFHDLLLTLADGSTQRTYQGVIVASPGVTRG